MTRPRSDTWFTPPALIEALGGAQSFDLDPCSHIARPWPTAREHFTREDNGLLRPWFGRVWLNPPYAIILIRRFLARMAAHGRGVALIPARTETEHFFAQVWEAADGVLFLHGRLCFHDETGAIVQRGDGTGPQNAGSGHALVAYGADDLDLLAAAPIDGHLVPLRIRLVTRGPIEQGTWRECVLQFFQHHEGPVRLDAIYRAFAGHPKARANQHWREKLRQVLQRGAFERVERGVWQRRAA